MHPLTDRFVTALHQLHVERDVEPLVQLFGDSATLSKLGDHQRAEGKDGARRFWQDYREVFDDIEATFTTTIEGEDGVALEWTSKGTLSGGAPFSYAGVSVLEGDLRGADGSLGGFRTYYDSAVFTGATSG